MIDIHSHILFGIDDGCKTLEDSIRTIKNLKSIGFDKLILTPHYIKGASYVSNNKEKKAILNALEEEVRKNDIEVDLYLGNEIFINDEIDELIINKEIKTLNNSRYVLIELPFNNHINNIEDYLYELKINGYIPIIAHPERYTYFQKDHDEAKRLYESGVYFQCNYESIIGKYGREAMNLFIYLLKHNMVSFMGTDVHKPDSNLFNNFNEIKEKIKEYVTMDKFNQITNDNLLKVINDEEIAHEDVILPKSKFWFFKRNK